ncbi:fimbrillin family protein [uncultured Bacteroides sp.]|uniref:fimbrillin family protein n=1 Tax=uncultured Bacteroides sp. TaxID=162156 RepID=UPI0025CF6D75|nr:fimbrillin family protein [uncultured Bacteroides sp.]
MAIAYSVSSCIDDTFNKYQQEETGLLTFDVEVPNNWSNGLSRAATDISIKKMSQSDDAEPLYLVTEISEATVNAAASDAVTRGTPVTSTDKFYDNFGLSAICYTGEWPTEEPTDWSTNFARNLKVSKGTGTTWNTEEKLNWLGSGKIRFFAYSPYSATDKPENGINYSNTTIPTLTYTVPEDVKAQCDLMTAMEDCPGGQGGAVSLKFKHTLTAVTIKTGQKMLEGTITKVSLTGVHGKGTHQIGSDKWTTTSETTDFEVTLSLKLPEKENNTDTTPNEEKDIVDYTKPGEEIVDGELTFMMIPQTLPTDAKLIVEFTDSLTHTPRTLTAKLEGSEWPMGKKVAYSISSTGIIVEPIIDLKINHNDIWMNGEVPATKEEQNAYLPVSGYLHDVQLAAYAKVVQEGQATKNLAFSSVEIEYSTNNGNSWTTTQKGSDGWLPAPKPEDTATSTITDDDPVPFVSGSILLPAQDAFKELRDKATNATNGIFKIDEIKGSKTEYHDLVENNPVQKESANCYVINQPGYYKFPAWYGNTYQGKNGELAYTYNSSGAALDSLVLKKFVGHDDTPINGTKSIPNVHDAMLVWQDSPDLVTDIEYKDGWVYFYMPKEAFNQGNAVIAVRGNDDEKTILWSWHIWATYCDLEKFQESKAVNVKGQNFQFLCTNLGYCDPHGKGDERTIKIRFWGTMPNGTKQLITKNVSINDVPVKEEENGVFTFTQPGIVESTAGDNPYFQWGRKDPMLPGVYNAEILAKAPIGELYFDYDPLKIDYKEELDMENKVFYSTTNYKFTSAESGRSIGESIKEPHHFFIHRRPASDKDTLNNYLRRHWHNGEKTIYKQKTIMNFWNSQLDESGNTGSTELPNNKYVVKTIYDPSPAGYKIPPPSAFSKFANTLGATIPDKDLTDFHAILEKGVITGWNIREKDGGNLFLFPATGLRDMGIRYRDVEHGTWPAHSKLTFIASSGFKNEDNASSSCLLFSIDNRQANDNKNQHVGIIYGTNNAYGFTLRPIRERD